MKFKWIKIVYILLALSFVTAVFAENNDSPVDMLRTVSTQVIDKMNVAKQKVGASNNVPLPTIRHIVSTVLLPHVDLDHMSRAVLGRNTWIKASVSQQEKFKQQFTDLVINTYASALKTFDKRRLEFFPIRGGYKDKTIIQVSSTVHTPDEPLHVVYSLERKNGQWLIYDISVDGVSLLQSYRAQFATLVENKGLNGLLNTLTLHNKTLVTQYSKAGGS